MIKPAPLSTATLEGHLERITYFNDENHYTIGRLKTVKTGTRVTVVGFMPKVGPGERLKLEGKWETHPKYGQQFRFSSYTIMLPSSVEGIRKYLESGIIKGIGPQMARRLITCFGEETLDIIEKNPERLLHIEGIGKAKADLISKAWQEHHVFRRLTDFLKEMGVPSVFSAKIQRIYGPEAETVIRNNPYCLADDIPDNGFDVADAIARNLGIAGSHPERAKACLIHILNQAQNDGHVFVPKDRLIEYCENSFMITTQAVEKAMDALVFESAIVVETKRVEADGGAVYLKPLHRAETGLANRLKALMSVPVQPPGMDGKRISEAVVKKLGIQLSEEQLYVLEKTLALRAAIITGGPGTGKTTLIRSITAVFEALGKRVRLAAPTGRAARRLSEVTRRKAGTIHRLLGYSFKEDRFDKNEQNPLETDALIVDEASMVDTLLMYRLMQAVPLTAVLVLVGDVFQLPSVGPGNVLSDMIDSNQIRVFYLNEIFRQAKESPIIENAHRVRDGRAPTLNESMLRDFDEAEDLSEFYFLEYHDPEKVVSVISDLCTRSIPERFGFDPISDIQVLTPMHRGLVGAINLNQTLQSKLNPNPIRIRTPGGDFKTGDKVMHLKNNYQKEVFNGDIGVILDIDKKNELLTVDYYGRAVSYDFIDLDEISLAYAITVHKSQGSEYPAVIVPLMTQHYPLLQRNLVYTALTRGQKLVILAGTQKALAIALQNDKPRKRESGLMARLRSILL